MRFSAADADFTRAAKDRVRESCDGSCLIPKEMQTDLMMIVKKITVAGTTIIRDDEHCIDQ
jgi:hypothetical protein